MIQAQEQKGRSIEENKYYHGVVVKDIAEFKKWTNTETHEWVKETFGIDSTATLTTIVFEDLMDDVRYHVYLYWGLEIALPNQ